MTAYLVKTGYCYVTLSYLAYSPVKPQSGQKRASRTAVAVAVAIRVLRPNLCTQHKPAKVIKRSPTEVGSLP